LDEDRLNISIRKFLKNVGVTSQRKIEEVSRELGQAGKETLKVKMVLTAEGSDLEHIIEGEIDLG